MTAENHVVAIIQARMGSRRLPDKVLLEIGGRPMLAWVVERTRRAQTVDQVVVATTDDPEDEPIVALCEGRNYAWTRGSVHDVLDRYYQTAELHAADVIVRITADCPLIDPGLVDETVTALFAGPPDSRSPRFDFTANRLPLPWGRTYPVGLDTEVFTFLALEEAWQRAEDHYQREHVAPFFYDQVPPEKLRYSGAGERFRATVTPDGLQVLLLHHDPDYSHLRWTVDTPADLRLVREVVTRFEGDAFTWREIVALFEDEPELAQINAQVRHKTHLDVDDRT
jgi:spore coat polysaccharide biosynthesis protein SpsF